MLGNARLQTIICCTSRQEAEEFYVKKLGLRLKCRSFNGFVVDAGGGDLYLAEVPDPQPSAHTIVGFAVSDLAGEIAELAATGIRPERIEGISFCPRGIAIAPDGTSVAWLRDPDGNLLSVVEYDHSIRPDRPDMHDP